MNSILKDSIVLIEVTANFSFSNDLLASYHSHIFCHRGTITFLFNDKPYKCKAGEFVFWFSDSNVKNIKFSKGLMANLLLVEKEFLNTNIPDQSKGIDATLHSKEYPVLYLNDKEDRHRILLNFQLLNDTYLHKAHRFYHEALKLQMRLFILEMWHIFSTQFEQRNRTIQNGSLYERFIQLIREHCKTERAVQFYAERLNISPKYLNHICKTTTGITASDWIQRYVRERIELILQNTEMNIAEIANELEFSSRSFFTRYVKKLLGVTPRAYRNRLK